MTAKTHNRILRIITLIATTVLIIGIGGMDSDQLKAMAMITGSLAWLIPCGIANGVFR